ncbi:MAG: ACP S-malonyltransferase [Armatimonadota bacterium]
MSKLKYALLFPGQGSQSSAMGADLIAQYPEAAEIAAQADTLLGRSVTDLLTTADDATLKQTINSQPSLYCLSQAILAVLRSMAPVAPAVVAGHSLGEYAALSAAGVIDYQQGLKLIDARAQAMDRAAAAHPGSMAAILGLDDGLVSEACSEASNDGIVTPANFNSPGQVVISGEKAAVEAACVLCKQKGAKRALMLPVSGGFHSQLMSSAAEELKCLFAETEWKEPHTTLVMNVTAEPPRSVSDIPGLMLRQITSSVMWSQSLIYMHQMGVELFIEVGPGEVLCGLVKRTLPGAQTMRCGKPEEILAVADRIGA